MSFWRDGKSVKKIMLIMIFMLISSVSQADIWNDITDQEMKDDDIKIILNNQLEQLPNGEIIATYKNVFSKLGSYTLDRVQIDCKGNSVKDLGGRIYGKDDSPTSFNRNPRIRIDLDKYHKYKLIFDEVCK